MSKHYRTAAGSEVEISGKHNGIVTIDFDWFEENACPEARPVADTLHPDDPVLTWCCPCCDPGAARLQVVSEPVA